MIIWLASYPRSGNTYFRLLLNHLYGIKTRSVYDDPLLARLEGSSELVGHELLNGSLEDLDHSKEFFFVKTHHLPSDNRPAIQIVRDGRDALVSYSQFTLSFENPYQSMGRWSRFVRNMAGWSEQEAILRQLIVSTGGDFGGWSENVVAWGSRRAKTVTVRYEDLVGNPIDEVTRSLAELQISGDQLRESISLPSFDELNKRWPHFFRQGKTGGWKSAMTPKLADLFWDHHRAGMELYGYQ